MKTSLSFFPGLALTLLLMFITGTGKTEAANENTPALHEFPESDAIADAGTDSAIFSDDFFETLPDGSLPPPPPEPEIRTMGTAGPIAPAAGQPQGVLSGKIVYTNGGHGWQRSSSGTFWTLDRPLLLEMNEAYGNRDQMSIFAEYAFNAGATVVAFRPIGFQANEVVVDNVDSSVIWSGTWNNSTSNVYYGKPGQIPYRWANLANQETATATYVPNIPETGFYPVYTWARHGPDRTFQLYRIRHTGGESEVRIPHHKVGNGWIYLGTYYFNKGSNPSSGAVVISNLRDASNIGNVIIADAIRFGNGMSTDGSTYPKEGEASRYWIKNSLGVGQSTSIYDVAGLDDGGDNVGAPIRMAAEMNREAASPLYDSIYLSFHSNATTGNPSTAKARGTLALYNTAANRQTPHQIDWAHIVAKEVNDKMVAMNPHMETAWSNRSGLGSLTYGSTYGEINNLTIRGEFDATILEVAFHDNPQDALLLRDPKVRNWIARASLHGVIRYMNRFAGDPLHFLPEPPTNPRATAIGNTAIRIAWDKPTPSGGSGAPEGYIVYRSTDGYGFGNPVRINNPNITTITLGNFPLNKPLYFRISAFNSGGESFPSETIGAHPGGSTGKNRVLYVNAFDRFDRHINIRQSPTDRNYRPPGHNGNSGTIDRTIPRSVNSFDYVVQHGRAVDAAGWNFDSASRDAIAKNQISLSDYDIIIWAAGQNSIENETFNSAERTRIATFLDNGGSLFTSGSDIAYHLDRTTGPTTAERSFLHNYLRVRFSLDNTQSYLATPVAGTIFAGLPNATFDSGTGGIYPVRTPDRVVLAGPGSKTALLYSGGAGGPAAIQYDGSNGGGRVVFLAFPFETILGENTRTAYMERILDFLDKSGYARWQEQFFTTAEINDPDISGKSANPAGDGIPNLLKFAFHLDPKKQSRHQLPETGLDSGFITFSFRQSKLADNLTFETETSNDLINWTSAAGTTDLVSRTDHGDYEIIILRDKTPASNTGRRFFRLRLIEN